MIDPEVRNQVAEAISASQYRWRTPVGIANETGLPYEQVLEALNTDEHFVRSKKPNAKGLPLYTTREKRNTKRTFSMRFVSALTNKMSE